VDGAEWSAEGGGGASGFGGAAGKVRGDAWGGSGGGWGFGPAGFWRLRLSSGTVELRGQEGDEKPEPGPGPGPDSGFVVGG
jgi:hypothetical protein